MKPSPDSVKAIAVAQSEASNMGHSYVTLEHLLFGMIQQDELRESLEKIGVDVTAMEAEVINWTASRTDIISKDGSPPEKTALLERIFQRAYAQVLMERREVLDLVDLLVALVNETSTHASYFIIKYMSTSDDVYRDLIKAYRGSGSAVAAQDSTSVLEEHCDNLNKRAEEGHIDPVIGRDRELEELCQVLGRRTKSNILMVGDPGVGKTAVAEGLALRIQNDDVPDYLKGHTVWNLDVGSILAGARFRGDFEEKVKEIVKALEELGNCILFIDEAHTMQGAGTGGSSQGGPDFANMLKPALSRRTLKVVASTTWEEYNQSFEKDRAFMRRFYRLGIDEPTPAVAKDILAGIVKYFAEFHGAKSISKAAISAAVDYSVRYQTDKKLPDKAIDLIDSACAKLKMRGKKDFTIGRAEVLAELSRMTGVSVAQMDQKKSKESTVDIEPAIKRKLFGQDSAVDTVLDRIWIAKAGLKSPNKPIGNFIFLGPTGTGKTELAKLLSDNLNMKLLRYDMSEYQEPHSVARFIGAPPGYVGHSDGNIGGGLLVEDVGKNPHAVILFDEVEKAHGNVLQVLLQLMDEGFITSANGKKADARNCVIILTSNLGAAASEKNSIGFGREKVEGADDEAYKNFFAPEFRNRVDAVCKFGKLGEVTMKKIVVKFLDQMVALTREQGYNVTTTDAVIDWLVENGFDPLMGARPLARTIDSKIKVPLARQLLFGAGANKEITVDVKDNNITFNFETAKLEIVDGTPVTN